MVVILIVDIKAEALVCLLILLGKKHIQVQMEVNLSFRWIIDHLMSQSCAAALCNIQIKASHDLL